MRDRIRTWHLIVAQAAADALKDEAADFRPNAEPFPGKALQPPCAVVYPGTTDDWLTRADAQSFCSEWLTLSIQLAAGPDKHQASWQLLCAMAESVYDIPALIKADVRSTPNGLAGKPVVEGVSEPTPVTDFSTGVFLGAFVTVRLPIHKLTG